MSFLKKFQLYRSTHRWANISLHIVIVIFIYLAISTWQTRNATRGIAPNFTGNDLSNNVIMFNQYRGKPVLLHFWATWCPVCSLEHTTISRLSKDYQVLTIASWSGDSADVRQFMQQENLHYPVIVDADGSIAKTYGVQGVPSSFIISDTGEIKFIEQGYTTEIGLRLRLWWL